MIIIFFSQAVVYLGIGCLGED
jgi:cytochrome b involved in lipid metabolism